MRHRTLLPLAAAALAAVISAAPSPAASVIPLSFYKGHDLSSLKMLEDTGTYTFVDTAQDNTTRAADDILADGGMNAVRMRLWVDPTAQGADTYGLNYTIAWAQAMQAKGRRLYLDMFFASDWADPSKQPTPAAWSTTDLGVLAASLRAYVGSTLQAFAEAGVALDIVALGNEIRNGMLWPLGQASVDVEPWSATVANFSSLAALWKSARAGVDDAVAAGATKPQVLIHIDNGWNQTIQERWFAAMVANGVSTSDWDVHGFSFYPFYGTAATFTNLNASLNYIADTYGKPIHVVETDYPAVCNGEYDPIPPSSEPQIPYNVSGQLEWVQDVVSLVKNEVPNGLGQGVWYWEPAFENDTSLGSDCNDATLFAPVYSGSDTTSYSRASVDMFLDD
ncbi:glycoside hydrolase family 53 protein [Coniophora puteana RWD-64-598 SS2]|uniref:Arabinogalactan endo-beta-1,4-galactanase n=1 Tax=Coniophora puteana (strain RWD-64-598) TaxID=741705 RepID=A0A5M3MAF2_CONPW|nr:glycoside hydrolase family 53 protein [Coniophora puteana RWD-64-598 SS2]EIW76189.1 glycoside hydrolase family 53 protein [Coniophora puteana RWD-64-598 SS2]